MTIKEFSQKYSLVFFWATIVLVALFLLTACIGGRDRHMMERHMMMKGGFDKGERYEIKMMDMKNIHRPVENIETQPVVETKATTTQ